MKNNPILTVKLVDVKSSGSLGPNLGFQLKIGNGETIDFGPAARNKFLYQRPWNSGAVNFAVLKAVERDPSADDIAQPKSKPLNLQGSKPYGTSGTDSLAVTIEGRGGYKGKEEGKTVECMFNVWWSLRTNVVDVIDFIRGEMVANLSSTAFQNIKGAMIVRELSRKRLFHDVAVELGVQFLPYLLFRNQVDYGKPWDHKGVINAEFGKHALDAPRGVLYQWDIWSNIHYGFIGLAAGFSRNELLEAAGAAYAMRKGVAKLTLLKAIANGTAKSYDQKEDQVAISIGFGLWRNHRDSVTSADILEAVRRNRSRLSTQDAIEGIPPASMA